MYVNALSTQSYLDIPNLKATSTSILGYVNSLSTNSTLSINNLNATSTSILGLVNGHTTLISNLNATSTTLLSNINSLSTNSTLSINNLNATSTTLLSNINSLSTNSTLSINNLNTTSTTLLSNINTISSNTYLITPNNISLTGTNPTYSLGSGGLIGYANTTPTTLSTSAIIGDSVIRSGTGNKLLLQSGAGTSSLYIDGSNNVNLKNPTTSYSSLNVSGYTTLSNATTCLSSLNVSGNSTLLNVTTCLSSLNVSGNTTLTGPLVINATLPNILLSTSNTYNIGLAISNGNFSNSAVIGDMVIRSAGNLLLQSGIYSCANIVLYK